MGGMGSILCTLACGSEGKCTGSPTDGNLTNDNLDPTDTNDTLAETTDCTETHKGAAFVKPGGLVAGGVANTATKEHLFKHPDANHLHGSPNMYNVLAASKTNTVLKGTEPGSGGPHIHVDNDHKTKLFP